MKCGTPTALFQLDDRLKTIANGAPRTYTPWFIMLIKELHICTECTKCGSNIHIHGVHVQLYDRFGRGITQLGQG